jgi:hypothetical protein
MAVPGKACSFVMEPLNHSYYKGRSEVFYSRFSQCASFQDELNLYVFPSQDVTPPDAGLCMQALDLVNLYEL